MDIRPMTMADADGIRAVVASRTHYLASSPNVVEDRVEHLLDLLRSGARGIGLFEDDGLDCFFIYREMPGLSPRSDGAGADRWALVDAQWARMMPGGRTKLPTGQDVNNGHLLNAAIADIDDHGLYSYWYVTPAGWTAQGTNPLHADLRSRRTSIIAAIVPANSAPVGQFAGFVERRIMKFNRLSEPFAAHLSTLKDEWRHAGRGD